MADILPFPDRGLHRRRHLDPGPAFSLIQGAHGVRAEAVAAAPAAGRHAASDNAQWIADVLMALEAVRGDCAISADREPGDAAASIFLRLSSGLWVMNPAEAIDVAAALRADPPFFGSMAVAKAFEQAAAEARELDALCDRPFVAPPAAPHRPLTIGRLRLPWPELKAGAVLIALLAVALLVWTGSGR